MKPPDVLQERENTLEGTGAMAFHAVNSVQFASRKGRAR